MLGYTGLVGSIAGSAFGDLGRSYMDSARQQAALLSHQRQLQGLSGGDFSQRNISERNEAYVRMAANAVNYLEQEEKSKLKSYEFESWDDYTKKWFIDTLLYLHPNRTFYKDLLNG